MSFSLLSGREHEVNLLRQVHVPTYLIYFPVTLIKNILSVHISFLPHWDYCMKRNGKKAAHKSLCISTYNDIKARRGDLSPVG